MTTATIALTELAEKGADIDVLRQMVQFMAQRLPDRSFGRNVCTVVRRHPTSWSGRARR